MSFRAAETARNPEVDATKREKQIKSWSRAKKEALIATMNPEWKDLAAEWYVDRAESRDSSPSSRLGMTKGKK